MSAGRTRGVVAAVSVNLQLVWVHGYDHNTWSRVSFRRASMIVLPACVHDRPEIIQLESDSELHFDIRGFT